MYLPTAKATMVNKLLGTQLYIASYVATSFTHGHVATGDEKSARKISSYVTVATSN